MTWQWTPLAIVLLTTSALAVGVAIGLMRYRRIRGIPALAATMFAVAWWALAVGLESAAVPLRLKILLSTLEYAGSGSSATLFLFFALRYTGRTAGRPRRTLALLWALPIAQIALVATNDLHHWIWTGFTSGPPGSNILVYHHGPAFFIVVVGLYIYLALAMSLLVSSALRAPIPQRRQTAAILVAAVFPILGGLLYTIGLTPVPGLDLAPISFLLSGLTLSVAIVPLHLFKLVPAAREALIERMSDGIIVVDAAGRIVDSNPAARALLSLTAEALGTEAAHALAIWPEIAPHLLPHEESHLELTASQDPLLRLDVRVTPLKGGIAGPTGHLLVVRDVTGQYRSETMLQEANEELHAQVQEVQRLQKELREQALRDPLTKVFNRRYFDEAFPRLLERATHDGRPLAVVLFDIDLFKKTNDTYGHRVGDELLVVLGRLLTRLTRPGDIACRLGGEEFVLVLPETDLSTAVGRADEIRRAFAAAMVPGLGLGTGPTLSAGAAAFPDHGVTPDELVHAADGALYRAKGMGRNRVCTARGDVRS